MDNKYNYLNGLRGYGAFAVFIYHAKFEFRNEIEKRIKN
jgi:peptidoglycan/LPS O-acetylase OafA/YrhL